MLGSWSRNIILYCVVELFSVKRVLTFVCVCGGGAEGGRYSQGDIEVAFSTLIQ